MPDYVSRREFENFRDHLRDLREADQRALSIKETADLAALGLAREHQVYRDEQANQLREQINSERGGYVTRAALDAATAKIEAQLHPVLEFMASQQGRSAGISSQMTLFLVWLPALAAAATAVVALILSR